MANNAITIDVEEWFHVCGVDVEPELAASYRRVLDNTECLLDLLAAFDVKATFFVLGAVAEEEPALVPKIAAAGHEIASHGYSHRMVSQLDPRSFRDEIRRTGEILERQGGSRPVGYRAPQWSLSASTPWALDILKEEGYLYDSSMNPLHFVGNPRGPRGPHVIATTHGDILELPPMVTPLRVVNLPTGGGWGFRLFSRTMIDGTVQGLNATGNPAVFYFHPREMEAFGPRLELPPLKSFATYGLRNDIKSRLKYLLERFNFVTMRQLVDNWISA